MKKSILTIGHIGVKDQWPVPLGPFHSESVESQGNLKSRLGVEINISPIYPGNMTASTHVIGDQPTIIVLRRQKLYESIVNNRKPPAV